MNYLINPKAFSAVFTVPAAVADKHLKLARGEHIKVLLYIMRNMSVNPDNAEIAAAAGLSEYEVEEALLYWAGAGILLPDGRSAEKTEIKAPAVKQNTTISAESSSTKMPPTGPSQRAICAPGSSFSVGSGGGTIFGMA